MDTVKTTVRQSVNQSVTQNMSKTFQKDVMPGRLSGQGNMKKKNVSVVKI